MGVAKLVSCPGRHLTWLRPWLCATFAYKELYFFQTNSLALPNMFILANIKFDGFSSFH